MTHTNSARGKRAGARRRGTRERRARVLVVLGGVRTEPQYFEYVKRELRVGGLDIELIAEGWTPLKLYEYAIELKAREKRAAKKNGDSDNVYDEVWVVSDVDEFVDELKQMKLTAEKDGISLAITNPCFEAWLSMHIDASGAKLDRHQAQSLAKNQGLVDPDKPKNIIVEKVRGRFDTAATHARRHAAGHQSAGTIFPHDVPASDVDLLVGGLRNHALRSNPNLNLQL